MIKIKHFTIVSVTLCNSHLLTPYKDKIVELKVVILSPLVTL